MPKLSQKKFPKMIRVSLWPPSSLDHNPLDYTIWGVLENKNKKKPTSHPNFGSLMTAIKKEWNEMSEESILKACESFQK